MLVQPCADRTRCSGAIPHWIEALHGEARTFCRRNSYRLPSKTTTSRRLCPRWHFTAGSYVDSQANLRAVIYAVALCDPCGLEGPTSQHSSQMRPVRRVGVAVLRWRSALRSKRSSVSRRCTRGQRLFGSGRTNWGGTHVHQADYLAAVGNTDPDN
jgi:hypothetical protein